MHTQRPQRSAQLFFVTIAMVAMQLVALSLIADSDGTSGGGNALRVLVMLGFTAWFAFLWIDRQGSKWVLVLPALVPIVGFGFLIHAGQQPPPPREALRAAITQHCGLGKYDIVPQAYFMEFDDEIIVVVGTRHSDHIHHEGAEYQRLRGAVLGGTSLGADRIACAGALCSLRCEAPRNCYDQDVSLFEIGTPTAAATAEIFRCKNFGAADEPFRYEFGSSSNAEMERLVRRMYDFGPQQELVADEAMEDADPADL